MKINFGKVGHFFKDVANELKAVSFPTKEDIKEGTIVVIVVSMIVAIFLSLVDFVFGRLMTLIF
ncbi:MAG: preprotein translocase subunit SecE [Candidatus Cloacimonadota bacterium]|jgi:preprotein translocase subunit SecE|uniref:preprotein translocase subunit SecE n=1 Tax=Candidatus Syntrophosphaera thermopropionivorans TaxID=2593015 RepID=UPI001FB798D5|nr:preprotein translocase subunit SecE [Candidatus Syntrophosphaera thermopropionivorans]MDI9571590.1 preprotein translocase subunit SecE [Candidatus Cloacimonadota bacterium]HPQ30189.1 preprotein translocase subunit SecE [Candidatus Syntrophosphaera thermopropionivorans]